MTLRELIDAATVSPVSIEGDASLTAMTIDSRQAKPGAIFVCMPGMTRESEQFIGAAAQMGATAALVYSQAGVEHAKAAGIAYVRFPEDKTEFQRSLWRLCDAFFQHPTRNMKLIGVTGTNGKTTTAWLMRDILNALGLRAGYIGTLGIQLPGEERELNNTTPFAVELYNLVAEARNKGVNALTLEISSHALAELRADGLEFDSAVFTNLTQDHLDFHKTMDEYEKAKWRLFDELPKQTEKRFTGVVNIDDATGAQWRTRGDLLGYSLVGDADITAQAHSVKVDSIEIEIAHGEDRGVAQVRLGGNFNVYNTLSAVAGVHALGYTIAEIMAVLPAVHPVPGRFEAVPNDLGIGVLVDYAHTHDALEKLLDSVIELKPNKIITVFGCGGDRDPTKRPKMARSASQRSDLTVVTSDNPRTEDPEAILAEVLTGIVPGKDSVAIIDRKQAIQHAISVAEPGDVVVIAGKGHENYQIIGRTKYPMDDRLMAKEALEARKP